MDTGEDDVEKIFGKWPKEDIGFPWNKWPNIVEPWKSWDKWPTIDKLDPELAVASVIISHYYRFNDNEGFCKKEGEKECSLKDFSRYSRWFAVNIKAEHGISQQELNERWKTITGIEWGFQNGELHEDPILPEGKNWKEIWGETIERVSISGDPNFIYENNIEYLGEKRWNIDNENLKLDGCKDTWKIHAKNGNGKELFTYYYTYDNNIGKEVWLYNNENAEENEKFRYIFVREYTKDQYPLGVTKEQAGEPKLSEPAIDLDYKCNNVDVVLVIDRSGSMSSEGKIDNAKKGAKSFIDLMKVGDRIGVVSFASGVSVDYELKEITSDADKDAVKNKIDSISAGGLTAMGDGLRQAYNQLINNGDPSHPKAIVLLSNGYHNAGNEDPLDVLKDIKDKGIKVYSIALGSSPAKELLLKIAEQTGGKYYDTVDASKLQEIYNLISGEISGEEVIKNVKGEIKEGEKSVIEVIVDKVKGFLNFILNWGGSDLDLTLRMPNGTIIDPSIAATDPNIEYNEGDTNEFYRIQNPMPGKWEAIVEGIDTPPEGEKFTLLVSGTTDLTFTLDTDKSTYTYPEPIKITGKLEESGNPVLGADVKADITRPDSSKIELQLFDDGLSIHGDDTANDGVYTNLFNDFTQDGSYLIVGKAEGTDSSGLDFTREDQKTVLVSGVPQFQYNLFIFEDSSLSDGVINLNQEVRTIANTTDPNIDKVTFRWIDPNGNVAREVVKDVSFSEDVFAPYLPGTWTIQVDFMNGTIIEQTIEASLFVLPESPIGAIAIIGSGIAMLSIYALRKRR